MQCQQKSKLASDRHEKKNTFRGSSFFVSPLARASSHESLNFSLLLLTQLFHRLWPSPQPKKSANRTDGKKRNYFSRKATNESPENGEIEKTDGECTVNPISGWLLWIKTVHSGRRCVKETARLARRRRIRRPPIRHTKSELGNCMSTPTNECCHLPTYDDEIP